MDCDKKECNFYNSILIQRGNCILRIEHMQMCEHYKSLKAKSDGLANISLKKGEDGHWLSVKASNGKQASICIENMDYGSIVKQALVQWAEDQFKDVG